MKVKKLVEDAFLPTVKHEHDAGMDFYSLENYIVKSQKFSICRTGITVEIPFGVMGQIWPKSKNDWLIGAGIFEWTYQGEVLIKIFNISDHDILIKRGDPLGQMAFVYNLEPTVEEVDEIHEESTARGTTGGIVTEFNYMGPITFEYKNNMMPIKDDNGIVVGWYERTGDEVV